MCQGRADGADDFVAIDVESMLSREGRARQMDGLRKVVTAFSGIPGFIGLHGGLPPATAFPIKGVTLTLENGHKVEIDDPIKVRMLSGTRHAQVLSKHAEGRAFCCMQEALQIHIYFLARALPRDDFYVLGVLSHHTPNAISCLLAQGAKPSALL